MKKTFIQLTFITGLSLVVFFSQLTGIIDFPWFVHLGLLYLTTLKMSNTIHQLQTEKDLQMQPSFLYYEEGILREIFN